MKFKFAKNLDYQLNAINSVVDLFDTGKANFIPEYQYINEVLQTFSAIVQNGLLLNENKIIENLQTIQKKNGIESSLNTLQSEDGFNLLLENGESILLEEQNLTDFSVEMETGTGKTYVYLRTILELNKKYNLKKFIILVPSVAIREGVLKTLEQTKEHFRELYNIGFGYFAYDSDKLSQVRDYIQSNDLQIMIMTIQSFNTDTRILRQTPDRFHGDQPLDLIAQTRPVVIMDEPQNMESELAKQAIQDLKPLFKLRYSATHKEIHNLVYRLTPVDAYKKGLVKKIAVYGVKENDVGAFLFRVNKIETKRGENPRAKVLLEIKNADLSYTQKEVILNAGDDLYRKSKKNEKYNDLIVQNIDANHNRVELSDGNFYKVDARNENKEVIFRTQIRETIKAHFDKQEEIGDTVKVLSLFFIDKVDNYMPEKSLLRTIFKEEFTKLQKNYSRFKNIDADTVHKGYFASKKIKGVTEYKDSVSGNSKEDKEAYDLIMKNKEQLLSFSEPVAFIFSHSALKEGWDNPNIFQICTLRETQSLIKKRQEIGRGMRLPVDIHGNRIEDNKNLNVLTVIANSSYEEYASGLQQEFEEAGYKGEREIQDAKQKKITVKTTRFIESPEFLELWKRISKRTKFSLEVTTNKLIKNAVEKINNLDIKNISVTVEKGEIYFDKKGNFSSVREASGSGYTVKKTILLGNIVERIAQETFLTKETIFSVLSKVGNLDLLFQNPEEYLRSCIIIIKNSLNNLLSNEGLKYIPTGEVWEIKMLFTDFETLPNKVISVEKSVFNKTVFDSKGEKEFAEKLEASSKVKVYTKLPRGFTIDTPLGKYTPDWAIVWYTPEGEKLYLVRETKFDYKTLEQISWEETQKINCAEKHFDAIGVDYKVTTSKELQDLL